MGRRGSAAGGGAGWEYSILPACLLQIPGTQYFKDIHEADGSKTYAMLFYVNVSGFGFLYHVSTTNGTNGVLLSSCFCMN